MAGQPRPSVPPGPPELKDFIKELAATERDATDHSSINQDPDFKSDV